MLLGISFPNQHHFTLDQPFYPVIMQLCVTMSSESEGYKPDISATGPKATMVGLSIG